MIGAAVKLRLLTSPVVARCSESSLSSCFGITSRGPEFLPDAVDEQLQHQQLGHPRHRIVVGDKRLPKPRAQDEAYVRG